jgi:perosamine synthetase
MHPSLVERELENGDIDCVMFVNHNAYVGEDVQAILSMCDKHDIPMLEDSSQALGMQNAGRTGKVGIFSFSVPKLITTGQGGVIITDDATIANNCMAIRDHGDNWRLTKVHERIGGNFKFNDILAAYGLSQLRDLDQLLAQRKVVFDHYRSYISIHDYGYDSTWMVLYHSNRAKAVIAALAAEDIQATQYYRPINHNPPYDMGENYPQAEFIYDEVIYLPSSLSLTQEQIDRICKIVVETEGISL